MSHHLTVELAIDAVTGLALPDISEHLFELLQPNTKALYSF
jgi:hypothetical protein